MVDARNRRVRPRHPGRALRRSPLHQAARAAALLGAMAVMGAPACGASDIPPPEDVVEPSTSVPVPPPPTEPRRFSVLLFHRTEGFAHDAIPVASAELGDDLMRRGAVVQTTDDPADLGGGKLGTVDALVFLMTTGDVLDDAEQAAVQSFVEGGGGFVGVHSALDTEYDWPWYGGLMATWFAQHPAVQDAVVRTEATPAAGWSPTVSPPSEWTRTDEWYDTRTNPRAHPSGAVRVLATVDETTYSDGSMGPDHPIEWCRDLGEGRSFVTAMGHTQDSWRDPLFRAHVGDAVAWAANPAARCS